MWEKFSFVKIKKNFYRRDAEPAEDSRLIISRNEFRQRFQLEHEVRTHVTFNRQSLIFNRQFSPRPLRLGGRTWFYALPIVNHQSSIINFLRALCVSAVDLGSMRTVPGTAHRPGTKAEYRQFHSAAWPRGRRPCRRRSR